MGLSLVDFVNWAAEPVSLHTEDFAKDVFYCSAVAEEVRTPGFGVQGRDAYS